MQTFFPARKYLMHSSDGYTKDVALVNEFGLHARSAARIAEIAGKAGSKVWIGRGDARADAVSIIDILTLACPKGSVITIGVEDRSDLPILEELAALVRSGFEE